MKRRTALISALLLASCATHHPAAGPAPDNASPPVDAPNQARPAAPAADSAQATRLSVDSVSADSARLAAMARDSALDAAMLDRIAAARVSDSALPSAAPTEAETATLRSLFDIDVKNFQDHGRVKYWINFFTGPARERMAIWLERMPRYEPGFRAQLIARGLPGDLAYLPLIESGYSPSAVSRSSAVGMWQFMRGTGRFYGLTVDTWVDERRDVFKATDAAIRYLADLTARFGSPYLAAAAYNGGPGRIGRGLARLDTGADAAVPDDSVAAEDDGLPQAGDMAFFLLADTRYIRKETKDYVPKLIAAAMIAKQPERYGFPAVAAAGPGSLDSVVVNDATGLDVVARVSGIPLADVVEMNPMFVRGLTPPKRTSVIRMPSGTGEHTTQALANLPAEERLTGFVHHARTGETLAALGKKYGVALADMRVANPGYAKRTPRKGEDVTIPGEARLLGWIGENKKVSLTERAGRGGSTYRVKAGETLGTIARRYHVSVAQLRVWNDLGSKAVIRAGQTLRVGSGRLPGRRRAALRSRSSAVRAGQTH